MYSLLLLIFNPLIFLKVNAQFSAPNAEFACKLRSTPRTRYGPSCANSNSFVLEQYMSTKDNLDMFDTPVTCLHQLNVYLSRLAQTLGQSVMLFVKRTLFVTISVRWVSMSWASIQFARLFCLTTDIYGPIIIYLIIISVIFLKVELMLHLNWN